MGPKPGCAVCDEHFVPVVADPAALPAIPAAACQAHGVGVGRREERLCRGRPPVDKQPATLAVREAESADIDGLGVAGDDDASQAQVQAVAPQHAPASGQPVDRHVPVHAAGRPALGVEPLGQLRDRLLEAVRDRREVPFVAADQRRVGLASAVFRDVEGPRGRGVLALGSTRGRSPAWPDRRRQRAHRRTHISSGSGLGRRFCGRTPALPQAPRCAIC